MQTDSHAEPCNICPRGCHTNRIDERGFCGVHRSIRLANISLHFGEEPVISGTQGSATFFFSGCTLRCAFCQNWQISHHSQGRDISCETLAELFFIAEQRGAHNINLVSATQFTPDIIKAITIARERYTLTIPFMWNSGGYDSIQTIDQLKAVGVSIFLPDLKFLNSQDSAYFCLAKDYPTIATQAILRMLEDNPPSYNTSGLLQHGVIIRHLVMPGRLDITFKVLQWFKTYAQGKAILSLMTQYTPVNIPNEQRVIPQRHITAQEDAELLKMLEKLQIDDGFYQDLIIDNKWLPDFSHQTAPFHNKLAQTIWQWNNIVSILN
ncbi:4Fe-4S cluster-binding domain-containing protein [Entomospira nematocerorum]|uniref:4Fe-4S cluster-binding domain-containing protein n=1 Tax=Entomospira nematocerorum TaxID=2719987 RepID=A0A968GE63_9SPIO|nr:radical SAM protein [Entomospira nematocera]NIZ47412.1 4Fe-4S cluster-binding domain-containing protein [Entomospira nematocera]WDI34049.1 4Fe-4S cluster-binding domain-containing protein [Entomospira nematocera]